MASERAFGHAAQFLRRIATRETQHSGSEAGISRKIQSWAFGMNYAAFIGVRR